jgi:DNA-binding NtrC family response regulator
MEGRVMLTWKRFQRVWGDLTLRIHFEPTTADAWSMRRRMTVLLVSRSYSLRESLGVIGILNRWDVCWARSCDEAIDILKLRPIPLTICDEEALEGWRTVVERIVSLPQPSCVLVASRFCDEVLRREARRCHAYDVIAKPFNWEEVRDSVLFAWAWYTSGCASWWNPNADERVLRQR